MNRKGQLLEPDPTLLGWLHNYVRRHLWRVPSYIKFEDLVQDGLSYFYMVRERYGPRIKNRSHFMGLFKRCFSNYITDLSIRRTALGEVLVGDLRQVQSSESNSFEELLGAQDEEATFAVLIAEAPPEVAAVINLTRSEQGLRKLRSPHREFIDHRETNNERLCRLVGCDPTKINLAERVRQYLSD